MELTGQTQKPTRRPNPQAARAELAALKVEKPHAAPATQTWTKPVFPPQRTGSAPSGGYLWTRQH